MMKMGDGLNRESQNCFGWKGSFCANSTAMGRHNFQYAALNILHSQACPQLPRQCLESTAGLPGTGEQGMMTGAVLPCVQETSLCNSSDRSRAHGWSKLQLTSSPSTRADPPAPMSRVGCENKWGSEPRTPWGTPCHSQHGQTPAQGEQLGVEKVTRAFGDSEGRTRRLRDALHSAHRTLLR